MITAGFFSKFVLNQIIHVKVILMAALFYFSKRIIIPVNLLFIFSLLFLVRVFLAPVQVLAQTPNWTWASSAGESSSDYGNSIYTDANDNTYATGYFSQSITFGSTTLSDAGGNDIYLVKYNNQGIVVWAKSFGGSGLDYAENIVCDANGNIILTGAFRSESINFGSFSLPNPNSGNGYSTFFITKLNADGDVLWASTATSDGNCWGSDVDTDNNGNIVVTGSFDGASVAFGTTTLNNTYQFFADIFLVKYNASGEVLWAQSFGGNSYDYASGVATDDNGNINLIGMFQSPEITFGVTTFTNTGGQDYFIVHFNTDGLIDWLRNAPGDGDDRPSGITTNPSGDILVSGIYSGSSITFGMNTLPGNGYDNIFILKYSQAGAIQWIQSAAGSENDEAYAIAADKDGNVLVTGEFESEQLTFEGSFTVYNSSPGYSDLFVIKIDPSGTVKWATSAGGNDSDFGSDISTNSAGNTLITGSFYSSSILFGSTNLVNANSSNNSTDYFIAKLNSTTGIDETFLSGDGIICPNPANQWFTIQSLVYYTGNAKIELYDLNGKRLLNKNIPKGTEEKEIDVSSLECGVYCVRLQAGDKTVSKKLIIQR